MGVEGDAADLVRSAGAGVTCRAGDAKDLAEAVRGLRLMSQAAREEMGHAGRETFLKSFSRGVLLDRYEVILSELVQGKTYAQEQV